MREVKTFGVKNYSQYRYIQNLILATHTSFIQTPAIIFVLLFFKIMNMKSNVQKTVVLATLASIAIAPSTSAMELMVTASADAKINTMSMVEIHNSAANFLANNGVIVDQSSNVEMYNHTSNITRREMVKVAMNISGKNVPDSCTGEFSDLHSDDWGCKYAEAALANGFVAANASFRPDDLITNSESLKMIMQAKGIARDENSDWRAGYSSKAMSEWIIMSEYDFNAQAKRGWIFDTAALSYSEFKTEMMMEDTMMDDTMMEEGVMVGGALMVASKNIVENAVEADNVTTVVAAVVAADLAETLSSPGPFTVFAPNNAAFAALPAGTVETLLMTENKGQLTDILTYHVVAGSYTAADLTDGLTLTTVNGADLMFTVENGVLMINGSAMVETADVISSNGVTHVIDTVLMPTMGDEMMEDTMIEEGVMVGGAMMLASKNIVENAVEADNVTTVVAAVVAADLAETLSSPGPFTVFAPTNDAFAALPAGTVETLLMTENKGQLTDILTYHVVAGSYTSADLTDGLTLTTVNGADLMFTVENGVLMINGSAMVETADVISSNGVTHVIDTVLMPN